MENRMAFRIVPLAALAALASLASAPMAAVAQPVAGALLDTVCTTASTPLDDKGFVRINGMEQWVRIKGSSCANPIIVLIHGGPGNPTTPFADNVYKDWEQHYTIVQWDQRGSGMTYGRTPLADDVPLRIEQLRDDGLAVARFAAKRFGKRQVILMGGSWSSVLGVHMVKTDPAMFCGYISSSQLVNEFRQRGSYDATLARARAASDADSIAKLDAIGPPPWTNPRNAGILRRVIVKYERLVTTPAPKSWWATSPEYATAKAEADYAAGEDYSWLQFVGLHGDGIASTIDLYQLGPKFAVPFYMVQGAEDLLTMPESSKRYFDFIEAPRKQFVLVPAAGHDPNPPMVEAQYKLLREQLGTCG
jgi:pimeloyl-ACP methyl ester carboxylesterase